MVTLPAKNNEGGWVFGAFIFIPGIGHVAVGGYLLYLLATTGIGAVGGALAGH